MSVDKTNRPPDFKSDIDRYGTWGESLFVDTYLKAFKEKNYAIYNVTKDPFFQGVDIDFVIAKRPLLMEDYDGKPYYEGIASGNKDLLLVHPDFQTVEVKVDTRTIETGNIPYEMISHAQEGWCIVTKCDKVFFIVARENEDGLTPVTGLWLDMEKWREFISDRTTKKKCNFIKSENGIADLLCKVDDLRDYGVVIMEKSFENTPE